LDLSELVVVDVGQNFTWTDNVKKRRPTVITNHALDL
jgi:hypothetical protein